MTKVTAYFDLLRPLSDEDAEAVSRANSVYGIARIALAPTLDRITVDYDATRMVSELELENSLLNAGVPLKRSSPLG